MLRAIKRQLPDHPNICQLIDTFEDMHNIFIILDVCDGWHVKDYLDYCGFFEEDYARWVIQQVRCSRPGCCDDDRPRA